MFRACVRSCSCWASSRYKLEKNPVAPSSNGPSWWIATARGPSCLFWTPGGLCMNSGWQRTALKNSRVSLCPPRSRLQTCPTCPRVGRNLCSSPERRWAGESWPDIASMDDNSKLGRFETFALGSTLARAAIPRTWQLQIRTIYRLDLQGTESNYVARIPNATKLGPLAFDEAGRKIFIADLAVGAIYQYSLATKASRVLVSNLSAPTALSFYPETGRLYIADPGRRAIFTVNTRSSQPVLTEFVSEPLKSPYGMALLSSDRMAVADYGANSILVFSSKAQLLFSFPPKN